MTRTTRFTALVAAGLLGMALLGGCGKKAEDETTSIDDGGIEIVQDGPSDFPTGNRVELDQVLYDEDGLKVTATGFGPVIYYAALDLDIQNTSDKQMQVYLENNSLNGWNWDAQLVDTSDGQYNEGIDVILEPGETISCGLGYSNTLYLEPCHIEKMAQIGFMLAGYDPETGDVLVRTPELIVDLPGGEGYTQSYEATGDVAYDKDGITVIANKVTQNDWGGYEIPIFVGNLSDRAIKVYQLSRTIDGKTTDEELPTEIACAAAGKRTFTSPWIEEELNEGSTYEITLRISEVDPVTFEEIAEIDTCVVTNAG